MDKVEGGDELPPGVMKWSRSLWLETKIQPGDSMAGRHGNKGVISRIIPMEDMPYLEDGTPVDVVLNPSGAFKNECWTNFRDPSGLISAGVGRQIGSMDDVVQNGNLSRLRDLLQTVYGNNVVASDIKSFSDEEVIELCSNLRKGVPMATPVFDGAREPDINQMLEMAGVSVSGQEILRDGRTGEKFDRPVTVGFIYMLKLHHLVDDKIHARSIGPYSLVTQQPLGGKARTQGGQRFGDGGMGA